MAIVRNKKTKLRTCQFYLTELMKPNNEVNMPIKDLAHLIHIATVLWNPREKLEGRKYTDPH